MEPEKKNKKSRDFLRACRYLGPHRGIVFISILCAFVVGLTFTSGLGTMLPIMKVLINGETIHGWVNGLIVDKRLDMQVVQEADHLRMVKASSGGAAARAGLKAGQAIALADGEPSAARITAVLADANSAAADVLIDGRPTRVPLPKVPAYLATLQRFTAQFPTRPIQAIAAVLAVLVFLAVFGNIVRFFQEYLSEKAAVLAVRDIRRQVYDHTLHLHLSFYGQKGTSDVTSRLTVDAQSLQEGMKSIIGQSIQEPIKAGMVLALALFVSWQLTLFIIVFAPVMGLVIKKFGKRVRRAMRGALQNSATMLGQIESSLSGIRVVKAANAEAFERRRFRGDVDHLVREQLRIARLEAFNTPTLEVMTLLVVCCIVLYASYLVLIARTVDPTTFFLVMACLLGIGESLRRISKINNVLQKSNAAAARLFEVLDMPVERPRLWASLGGNGQAMADRPRIILPPVQDEIRFEDVTFTYAGAQSPAVQGVNLTVRKGQSIAVVGRNGSGKTTLLALLPRFYDPQAGRISIDGLDIRKATLKSLRAQIGIVTQDSVIFPGTIAQNIAYALPQASREAIMDAARRAFAHDFILERPTGYDTMLGSHGLQLSGGQKQRLCIARAILRKTPILILDEATSQVDAESEHLIQQAIESLMHERTTFVIAHRFSTILSADSIVVMDRGQIVGCGSHTELLANCPTYQQLYERQLVGAIATTA